MYTNVYVRAYYIPTVSGVGFRATEAAKYGDAKGATNNDDQWQVLEHGYANVVKQKGEINIDKSPNVEILMGCFIRKRKTCAPKSMND